MHDFTYFLTIPENVHPLYSIYYIARNASKARQLDWAVPATRKIGRKAAQSSELPNTLNSIIHRILLALSLFGQTEFLYSYCCFQCLLQEELRDSAMSRVQAECCKTSMSELEQTTRTVLQLLPFLSVTPTAFVYAYLISLSLLSFKKNSEKNKKQNKTKNKTKIPGCVSSLGPSKVCYSPVCI